MSVGERGEVWEFGDSSRCAGHEVTTLGGPRFEHVDGKIAAVFNGTSDALIVDAQPLAGAKRFTVELVFRPDPFGAEEQRFLHLDTDDSNRILLETRLLSNDMWFLDTFILSQGVGRTLYAGEYRHPLGVWYHVALVCDGTVMSHYVNGVKEMEAPVGYGPVNAGKTSIGCRMNRVYWFKGAVRKIRFSHRALPVGEMMSRQD